MVKTDYKEAIHEDVKTNNTVVHDKLAKTITDIEEKPNVDNNVDKEDITIKKDPTSGINTTMIHNIVEKEIIGKATHFIRIIKMVNLRETVSNHRNHLIEIGKDKVEVSPQSNIEADRVEKAIKTTEFDNLVTLKFKLYQIFY
jgi:hypothetical protein